MVKDRIYFGHAISIYNTSKEVELVEIIEEYFPQYNVENPNQPKHDEGYQAWKRISKGMDYFYKIVLPEMGAGIFLPFEDGLFGAGVYGEAEFLARGGKFLYEINLDGEIHELILQPSRKLSVEETRARVYPKK